MKLLQYAIRNTQYAIRNTQLRNYANTQLLRDNYFINLRYHAIVLWLA